jgi:hypothetical protein
MNHHLFAAGFPPSERELFVTLALLSLLILITRGRSLLAHGAFAGLFFGYLAFRWHGEGWAQWNYWACLPYLQRGVLTGVLVGATVRIYLDMPKAATFAASIAPADEPAKSNPLRSRPPSRR